MPTGTEFCLLGPLVVRCGGVLVPVRAGKQRAVLAALLLNAGRVVPLDELVEALWGSAPPPSARVTVQNYVMRLRKALRATGRARIGTQPGGYVLSVGSGELDVSRFEVLVGSARAAARDGSWDTAGGEARAALGLWRGEPLADVGSEVLASREVPRLAELRLQAVEARVDADLHLGRHADVIGELRQLTAANPLRERLHGQLMLALYRDGQQGGALGAYQDARRVLVEELGAEPGSGLRDLHHQILAADPVLAAPRDGQPAAAAHGAGVPRQLPGTAAHFAGRAGELAALTRLLHQAGEKPPGAVVISAIGGTAGVGKTALAVHWAHQVAERFPDGQLYVNLRGYDPGQPVSAADALAGFLRALGVAGQDIPAEAEERASRYRSLLAGRRVLVLLDNAGSAEQVRPLLPGAPACVVVVTSRDSLAGLVARDGAARLDLDLLPLGDAVGVLRALIGGRVDRDPAAAAALAGQCSRLPLALRVAAELAAARPAVPLTSLVGELADQQRRLDLLDVGGDPRAAVRAVFSWSYRHLDASVARAFRLAGLHPGPGLDLYAAAALTDTTLERAARVLDQLARAHLIHPAGPGRYAMHDLLRAYAAERAAAQDPEDQRRAALTRLLDHYLHTAAVATDTLFPAAPRRTRAPQPGSPGPLVTAPAAARAWLDAERVSLVAAAAHAAGHGWPGHAIRLAVTLHGYLAAGGYHSAAITLHTCARGAAACSDDSAAEAIALTSLGDVNGEAGRWRLATDCYQQALALFRAAGDQAGEARALGQLGLADWQQGHHQQAIGHQQQALVLYQRTGNRNGEAYTLRNLGVVDLRQGRYEQATDRNRQALALFHETGNRAGRAYALARLGVADLRQGSYEQAAGHFEQALALFRELGNRSGEAMALTRLGDLDLRQGRYEQATGHQQQALALARETGYRYGEANALNGLGEILLATGHPDGARRQHAAALGVADQIGDQYQQARTHTGLALSYDATGDPSRGRCHWQEALIRYTDLGAPEADQVRARLSA